jgi:hypothetical protein
MDFCQVHPDPLLIIIAVKITISLIVNFCCLPLGFIFRRLWVPFLEWKPATSILTANVFAVSPANDGIQS